MFHYHGPKMAGQMGMTLSLVGAIGSLSYTWLSARTPQFGILIARRAYGELDELFRRLLVIAMSIATGCWIVLCLLIYWLCWNGFAIAGRLLPMLPVVFFLAQGILNSFVSALALYLRAHKREPMMIPSLVGAVLSSLSTWLLGRHFGALGAAVGFFVVTAIWGVPSCCVIFKRCRSIWHSDFSSGIDILTKIPVP